MTGGSFTSAIFNPESDPVRTGASMCTTLMKLTCQSVLLVGMILISGCTFGWTEEQARIAAFKNIQTKINLAAYPTNDPDYQENIAALKNGQNEAWIKGRLVTAEPFGYMVSYGNEYGLQSRTMAYRQDGQAICVRLFSPERYPRAAYVYYFDSCDRHGNHYQAGELSSVSFHPSSQESFYFTTEGKLVMHDESKDGRHFQKE